MDATADELAGVVDLFGGLTRAELERALSEAAYRADGQSVDTAALEAALEDARRSFALLEYERPDAEALVVAGPTAFPTVPNHAEDVPHILDVERRRLDRDVLGEHAREAFRAAVDAAADAGDTDRLEDLLDISYDIETWAPVDLADDRARLETALES